VSKKFFIRRYILLFLLGNGTIELAIAQGIPGKTSQPLINTELCGTQPQSYKPASAPLKKGSTRISADSSAANKGVYSLKGNVLIESNGRRISTDEASYNENTKQIKAKGHISYEQQGLKIKAKQGNTDLKTGSAEFNEIEYHLTEYGGRGKAESVRIQDSNTLRLRKVSFTTCPATRPDWELKARDITIKKDKGHGYAKNVYLRFRSIPLFYMPALSFPASNQRKSGLLAPSIGNSDDSGLEASLPIYWNIAPNRDATITPRYLSKRGVQLNTEYRYLYPKSQGRFNLEYLSNDDIYKDTRYLIAYNHQKRYRPDTWLDVSLNQVSDKQYFDDLGKNLSTSSITHLEKRIDLHYEQDFWNFRGRLHAYQPISVNETWRRLPQLVINAELPAFAGKLNYFLNAEYTYFDHRDQVTTGSRLDLQPGIGLEWGTSAYFIRPRLSFRHTQYSLDNAGTGINASASRNLPVFSVDSQIYFDRQMKMDKYGAMTHTLSPRLYYLYVPYRDQADLPVFDSSILDFSYAQLFRENRFSGPDRHGDANQITFALSNRFVQNKSQRELLSLNMGMIYYLEDRQVSLPGNPAQSDNRSDFVAEMQISPTSYTQLRITGLWDTLNDQPNKGVAEFNYRRDKQHIFNAGYRYQRNKLEQTDFSTLWKLNPRWNAVARWTYSLRDNRDVERLLGLEYDACCWSAQIIYRDFIEQGGNQSDRAIYFQITLKGMTSLGSKIEDLLQESIVGYNNVVKVQ
jgi:LPS-assembly protein